MEVVIVMVILIIIVLVEVRGTMSKYEKADTMIIVPLIERGNVMKAFVCKNE